MRNLATLPRIVPLGLLLAIGCSSGTDASSPPRDAGMDLSYDVDAQEPDVDAVEAEAPPETSCGLIIDPDDPCQACTIERCCDQAEACVGDPACGAFAECEDTCGEDDLTCLEACILAHASGYPKSRVLATCQATRCNEECHYAPETACGLVWPEESCQSCAQQPCCDEMLTAAESLDRWKYTACVVACHPNDYDCFYQCNAQHEEGFAAVYLAINCAAISCTDACLETVGERAPCGLGLAGLTDPMCVSCVEEQCCDVYTEKSMSDSYWRYQACAWNCEDDACDERCIREHLEGSVMRSYAINCEILNCYDACDLTGSRCGSIYITNDVCNDCAQVACCDELSAYGSSLEGQSLVRCLAACGWGDNACRSQCIASYPDGWVLNSLKNLCVGEKCEACDFPGWSCGFEFDNSPDCGACVESNCCDLTHACGVDFDCRRIELCRHLEQCDNDDSACLDACKAANPGGAALFDAALDCRLSDCPVDCANY